jgi:hypothetical protein
MPLANDWQSHTPTPPNNACSPFAALRRRGVCAVYQLFFWLRVFSAPKQSPHLLLLLQKTLRAGVKSWTNEVLKVGCSDSSLSRRLGGIIFIP